MLKKTKALSIVVLLVLVISQSVGVSYAYTDYVTNSFNTEVTVNENNTYDVKEKITVDFYGEHHGIYRYIPYGNSDIGRSEIEDIYVEYWPATIDTENGNWVVQIGDEYETYTGVQKYSLGYTIKAYDDRDESRDYIYVNVIPTGWETDIKSANITVKFPKEVDKSKIELYTGSYGNNNSIDRGSIWYDESNYTLHLKVRNIRANDGVTVFAEVPEGYWVGEANYDFARNGIIPIFGALGLIMMLLWFFFGRDKKLNPPVEFYPPDGIDPAAMGYIIDGAPDKKDLTSLIVYFADKGHLEIKQISKNEFELIKIKGMPNDEKKYIKTLFNGLFKDGNRVRLDDLDEDFGERYFEAKSELASYFWDRERRIISVKSSLFQIIGFLLYCGALALGTYFANFYDGGTNVSPFIGIVSAVASIVTMVFAIKTAKRANTYSKSKKAVSATMLSIILAAFGLGYAFYIYKVFSEVVIAAVALVGLLAAEFAVIFMQQRTKESIHTLERIVGFRNFIEKAEVGRINALVEEDPMYFYNILPYAYVLGLTDKWVKNFESIKIKQPTWYSTYDNNAFFSYLWFSSCMDHMYDNLSSNIHIPSGEGGGFSGGGGGFSGGGFGGGGGGAW